MIVQGQVRVQLSPERLESVGRRHTRNESAYDSYLRGRRFWYQLTPASTRMAIEYYSRATFISFSCRSIQNGIACGPIPDSQPCWSGADSAVEPCFMASAS